MKDPLPVYLKLPMVLFTLVLIYWILTAFAAILIPLVLSLIIALLLYPVCVWLEKRKLPRGLAIILSMLAVTIVMGGILFLLTNEFIGLGSEIPEMTARMEVAFLNLQDWIERQFEVEPDAQIAWLNTKVTEFLENTPAMLGDLLFATTGFLFAIILMPFYIFFILYYRDLLKEFAYRATNEEDHHNVTLILANIQQVAQKYLVGLSTVIFIVFIMNIIALWLIGVDHALFFAIFAALLTAIPYIGVFIGSMVPALYSLAMTGSIVDPILIYGSFTVIQTIEANIITPRITGSKVSINPLTAIIALLVGGMVWGVVGMVMFIPLVAIVKVVFDHIEPLKPYGLLLGVSQKKMEVRNRWLELLTKGKEGEK